MRTIHQVVRGSAVACVITVVAGCRPAGDSTEAARTEVPPASGVPIREPVPSADPFSGPDSARVRARIDSVFARFDRPGSPGCVVTVMRAGAIVFGRGYGSADIERGTPLTTASAFDAASMAKQFTAFGIALLAGEGKLSLDDPVQKHLPELPDYGATITLRHLIHHTSGLRDWEAQWLSGRENVDPAMLPGLSFPPGEDHVYDDTGYALLERILEKVSGKSLGGFVRERIFEPLGMTSTGDPEVHRIPAYRPVDGGFRLSMTPPGEGFTTTPEDLARWDRNFYEPRVGGSELIEVVLSEGRLNNGETIPYAFGLHTEPYRGLRRVWHGGLAAHRSQLMRFPDQRTSVLTVCNVRGLAEPNGLTERVVDIVLEDAIARVGEDSHATRVNSAGPAPSPAELKRLAGIYVNRDKQMLRPVRMSEGRLQMRQWITWHDLRPLGAGRFRVEGQPLTLVFRPAPDGSARRMLEEHWDGRRTPVVLTASPDPRLSPAEMDQYTGRFRSDELKAGWTLTHDGDRLQVTGGPAGGLRVRPTDADVFTDGEYLLLLFRRDPAGRVIEFSAATPRTRNIRFVREGS